MTVAPSPLVLRPADVELLNSFGGDGDNFIHFWQGNRAVCGSTRVNHPCTEPDGSPIYADFHGERAPCCGKLLCPFCKLLVIG